jgi:hypothetical protein
MFILAMSVSFMTCDCGFHEKSSPHISETITTRMRRSHDMSSTEAKKRRGVRDGICEFVLGIGVYIEPVAHLQSFAFSILHILIFSGTYFDVRCGPIWCDSSITNFLSTLLEFDLHGKERNLACFRSSMYHSLPVSPTPHIGIVIVQTHHMA